MYLAAALENHLTSFLIITLILIDYVRKINTEAFQRFIFIQILGFALFSLACNLLNSFAVKSLAGRAGAAALLFITLNVLYYGFQVLSFFFITVLIDYNIRRDKTRSGKIIVIAWTMTGFYVLLLFAFNQYSFYINTVFRIMPLLIIIIDIFLSLKSFLKQHLHLLLIFWSSIITGFLLDCIPGADKLIWPCYSAALLYVYFLIITSDSKLDILTGIGNRHAFNEFFMELSRKGTKDKSGSERNHSIVMIDIDNFKKINDVLGHAEGDNALRDMAAIITRCIRHSDFAVRYGGDEFVLAVPAEYDVEKVMDRIQEALNFQNSKKIRPYTLEMSYGYDVYIPGKYKSMDEFLSHVDSLMYKQKEEHRRQRDGGE